MAGDEVALLIYRSNLLGADLRLTNYGGGNTSCKAYAKDPLTGENTEVMWVKGSGGDIGTLTRSGLAALYVDLGDVLTHNKAVELEHHYRRFFFRQDVEMMPTRIDELLAVAIDRFLAASTVGS